METETKETLQRLAEASERMATALETIQQTLYMSHKNVLNSEEAAQWLGLSKSRLSALVAGNEITHYKQNGKNYFAKDELEKWQTQQHCLSHSDMGILASNYVATHPLGRSTRRKTSPLQEEVRAHARAIRQELKAAEEAEKATQTTGRKKLQSAKRRNTQASA